MSSTMYVKPMANKDPHQTVQNEDIAQQKSISSQANKTGDVKDLFNNCAQVQRFDQLQEMARNSPQAKQTAQLKALMHNSPAVLAQRKKMELYKQLQRKKQEQPKENKSNIPNPQVIQRAIGFELEVPSWRVQHMHDKSRLPKNTEPIIEDKGFKLAADDAGKESDIEFVTDAIEDPRYLRDVMERLAMLGKALEKKNKKKRAIPAKKYKKYGNANLNAEFLPGDSMEAHIQATIGVPLEKLQNLYQNLAEGRAGGLAAVDAKRTLEKFEKIPLFPSPGLTEKEMSHALKGFLLLTVDYILAGFVPLEFRKTAKEPFPKNVFHLLAKTNFTKLLNLVPEKGHLIDESENLKEEWINWIIEAALGRMNSPEANKGDREKIDEPHFSHTFGEEGEKSYNIDTGSREWLKQIPKKDILTEHEDKRLEGMGSYKDAADQLVSEPERVELAAKMTRSFFSKKSENKDEKQKGKLVDNTPTAIPLGVSKEAPIFELRKIDMAGPPSKWLGFAIDLTKMYENVLQGLVYKKKDKPPVDIKK